MKNLFKVSLLLLLSLVLTNPAQGTEAEHSVPELVAGYERLNAGSQPEARPAATPLVQPVAREQQVQPAVVAVPVREPLVATIFSRHDKKHEKSRQYKIAAKAVVTIGFIVGSIYLYKNKDKATDWLKSKFSPLFLGLMGKVTSASEVVTSTSAVVAPEAPVVDPDMEMPGFNMPGTKHIAGNI